MDRFKTLNQLSTNDEKFNEFFIENPNNHSEVVNKLNECGLITFENINSLSDIMRLSNSLGQVHEHRHSNEMGITVISPEQNIKHQTGNLGFTSDVLLPHTDGSAENDPPMLILMVCGKAAERGGYSEFIDGKKIYESMREEYPEVLERFKVSNSIIYGLDPQRIGSLFEKMDDDKYMIRFRYDNWGYYSATLANDLPILWKFIRSHSFSMKLKSGQGFILQNGRWLHGRSSFEGHRKMYKVLIDVTSKSDLENKLSFGFSCV
jgi:alpha-ketoglutarate-dependent taurine dioxygenase